MKWSAITAVLAAPMALAGVLEADLIKRGGSMVETGSSSGSTVVIEETIVLWVNYGGGSPTTTLASSVVKDASAATHTIIVGGSAGLVYTPDTIEAAVGDTVIFTFMSANHTATQSSFNTPCIKLDGGFDSGFMPNINNTVVPPPQMAMQVSVSTPVWFYCRQKNPKSHCGQGMTFSINPTANKTQAMFEQMAIAQNGTGSTAAIVSSGAASATLATDVATTMATVAVASSTATGSSSISGYSGSSGSSGSMSSGSGSSTDGECSCSCFCGVAAFPSAVQGLEGYGGMSGSMPMSAMMV